MNRWHAPRHGFTIVELLIVIVVIGIVAGISIVAYSGMQARARTASYTSGLSNISRLMEIAKLETGGSYPATLPEHITRAGSNNTVRLASSNPTYRDLSPVQQGVLFQDICSNLVAEGYGSSTNEGGQLEQYITGCNVYGYDAMQINGWHARSFTVPIDTHTIYNWFSANVTEDAWRPGKKQALLEFAEELTSRHETSGGIFPVASFWDTWSAGVQHEDLPAPTSSYDPASYCIEIFHPQYPDERWHIRQQNKPTKGACS